MSSAIEQIYNQLMQVFGGTNPNQFFCMSIPPTILDQASYSYDTTKTKPALVAEAESRLVDQMFDLAQVTGSSNGERVSSQYLQALSVLVPNFDPMMPIIKNNLRDYLNSPAPANATVGDKPFVGDLEEFYFALYEDWLAKKSTWDQLVIDNKKELTAEAFLEWYEGHAESQLAIIDSAEGRLLSVFSPTDMDAILGALSAGPGGEIEEAYEQVIDLRLPSPSGGYVYPVNLTPENWFLDLASDQDQNNLLKDPQFIALTIAARRQAIQASISQIQSLLSQVPSQSTMAADATALSTAQTNYTNAQNALLNTYADNTATAVEMYLTDGAASSGPVDEASALNKINKDAAAASKAKGDNPPATGATKKGGIPLSIDDVKQLVAGQKNLIASQSALLNSAQQLANAGMNLASDQAQSFGDLPVFLARLQSQLSDLQTLQNQLSTAIAASANTTPSAPGIIADTTCLQTVSNIINTAKGVTDNALGALIAIYAPISKYIPSNSGTPASTLQTIYSAANSAWASCIADAVSDAANSLGALASQVLSAAQTAAAQTGSTPTSVLQAVTNLIPKTGGDAIQTALLQINTDANTAASATGATANSVAVKVALTTKELIAAAQSAATAAQKAVTDPKTTDFPNTAPTTSTINPVTSLVTAAIPSTLTGIMDYFTKTSTGIIDVAAISPTALSTCVQAVISTANRFTSQQPPAATPAGTSDRWMELQFSFTSDDMESNSNQSSLSSQTSWSVDLFFGSASGSSSSASSSVNKNSLDRSTSIQIGLKASKVDISRGWFDPGIFKLSKNMSRISTDSISSPPIDDKTGQFDWSKAVDANSSILPCFPVAFVVAKDVTIQFQVTMSSLSAVQSVLDSRSAVGGGFLCFSASSSSAAHSDSSSLHTKTEGTVITINMPGPQILGWFLELTPRDKSDHLTNGAPVSANSDINILQFVASLKRFSNPTNKTSSSS